MVSWHLVPTTHCQAWSAPKWRHPHDAPPPAQEPATAGAQTRHPLWWCNPPIRTDMLPWRRYFSLSSKKTSHVNRTSVIKKAPLKDKSGCLKQHILSLPLPFHTEIDPLGDLLSWVLNSNGLSESSAVFQECSRSICWGHTQHVQLQRRTIWSFQLNQLCLIKDFQKILLFYFRPPGGLKIPKLEKCQLWI